MEVDVLRAKDVGSGGQRYGCIVAAEGQLTSTSWCAIRPLFYRARSKRSVSRRDSHDNRRGSARAGRRAFRFPSTVKACAD